MSGTHAEGFAPVRRAFEEGFRERGEIGASFAVYHRGRCVVDLWGGHADVARGVRGVPWQRDTRIVVFSVSKGLAAMALALLANRGKLDWSAPVADVWPGFAQSGKSRITLRALFNHRAGLPVLDEPLSMEDCTSEAARPRVLAALERQAPLWRPGSAQAYHAVTFGMYAREVFERIAGEPMGAFLKRELFDPLGADVSLGTDASVDSRIATLYTPGNGERIARMVFEGLRGGTTEARVFRSLLSRNPVTMRAFLNPRLGDRGAHAYNDVPARRAELAWASATASAQGLARAYLPFASDGSHEGRRYLQSASLLPLRERQTWTERDLVLNKPIGWSQGFLKDETHLFSPNEASFGHAGMGGALGWADPTAELSFGYVMNRMDWRVRSPRVLALCRALYACEPLRHREARAA